MALIDTLPDPIRKVQDSGDWDDVNGTAGPGFASVRFRSIMPTSMSRTNGGRVITRSLATHNWEIDITYNPLTRDEFEPVHAFLMSRQGLLLPFYVVLPQYESSRSSTFAAYVITSPSYPRMAGAVSAGASNFLVSLPAVAGNPRPGDVFNIVDTANSNHLKTYMVTRVESTSDWVTADPGSTQRRIHISPPLMYTVSSGSVLDFSSPRIRVVSKGESNEYSLGTNNLYQFSVTLEEALP
jgi:hypothetical protein